ncbi:MAG: asparagine synthetase B [Proteobacteria bacterium SG_bin5]|nr:asparagine synthase (glutamine-hydrolyzing) [Sphingomonas sp.]OQW39023.1 MAG: asparagine synthetase B [Proteobacteria bacterium SG_bin5]
MCGIAGLIGRAAPVTRERIAAMIAPLTPRGPDHGGVWIAPDGAIGLGHRRLAIIDLSPAGHQPMHSACGRFTIVYNGEIYNFAELRARLEAEGGAPGWRGHSDTEVLLAAIRAWGLAATLERAAGMFALALWDGEARALSLARDRFGEKPLYYGWTAAGFAFASTLAPLRTLPGFDNPIEPRALAALMARAYVPAPLSIFTRVYKLPPGTILRMPLAAAAQPLAAPPATGETIGGVTLERWFDHGAQLLAGAADPIVDEAEALAALDQALGAAVARQLVADVPVGTFLSGGIDSSLVTALAQRARARPVKTFTIGFAESDFDEAVHAKKVAAALGTEHRELYVRPSDALAIVPALPRFYDEPFADSSQLPTHLVAKLARGEVSVALSGDGGDELFGGYNRHQQIPRLWRRMRRLPAPARAALLGAAAMLPPGLWDMAARASGRRQSRQFGANARRGLRIMAGAPSFDALLDRFLDDWADQGAPLVLDTPRPAPLGADPRLAGLPLERAMMHVDATTYLPDDILCKVDRAAMAVGLETRVPFLDPGVAAVAARIAPALNFAGGGGKAILKTLLYTYVPRALVDRPKAGFAVPLGDWLRGPLRDWAEDLLAPQALAAEPLFAPQAIRARWAAHLAGREEATQPLWSVLMYQAWRRTG